METAKTIREASSGSYDDDNDDDVVIKTAQMM
jgi:hypothetical protein